MQHFRTLYRLMNRATRWRMFATCLLTLLSIAAEIVTIGAVLPLLALASDPESGLISPGLREWLSFVGGTPLVGAAMLLALAAVAAAVVRLLLAWTSQSFVMSLGYELATSIFSRILRQPYSAYVQSNSSEALSAIEKVQRVIFGVLQPAMQGLIAAFMAVLIGGVLLVINATATIIGALSVAAAYTAIHWATRRRLRANSRVLAEEMTQRTKLIQEALGGIRDIILEQSYGLFEAKFGQIESRFRRAAAVNFFIASSPRFIVESAVIVAISAVILVMSARPGDLVEAIPVLGALALGAQRLLPLVQQAWSGWSNAGGNFQLLADIVALVEPAAPPSPTRAVPLPFSQAIVFDRVSYRYEGGHFALKDISFRIAKGQRIGVAGTTGGGKSTLLDLLMGLLEPDQGAIVIDGKPLDAATMPSWQAAIAHVPQAIFLADDTIAANIAFASVGPIDREGLEQAAEAACLDEFIAELTQGYDTRVGERGIRLSGGQRQRVGIARALYKRASLLIVDEATNALDEATEAAVMRSIAALPETLTIVMATHRLSTLESCDRVLRIEGGVLVES